jgi:HEAT repeat protein
VRAAALEAEIPTGSTAALEAGFAALDDPDPGVRLAAGQALGAQGAQVVPRLREMALARSGRNASGPLGALAFAGAEGQAVLLELSHTHPSPDTRGLARMLLGLDPKKP